TVKSAGLDFELLVRFGKLFEQTSGSARVFVGESNQGRTSQYVVQAREFGTFNRTTQQGVTHNAHVHTGFTSGFTQDGHLVYSHAARIGYNCGQGAFGSLVDFRNNCLSVFESQCHWLNSWIESESHDSVLTHPPYLHNRGERCGSRIPEEKESFSLGFRHRLRRKD